LGGVTQNKRSLTIRRCAMQVRIELPKAFSVRDEHEFFPIQHLMARLNPELMVEQVATGVHVNGGCTVLWGIIYVNGQQPGAKDVENALREAGFDFAHNTATQAAVARTHSRGADGKA
jgi:hypothetical protein